MNSMGELTFFLGLQVKHKEDGIFISQDKYVAKILKKFNFMSVKTASTLIETKKPLVMDEEAADVDIHLYRSMIGTPKSSHLHVVKRIFRYLKGKPKLGLWYPRESAIDLEAYSDSDYAGANLDKKSTIGGCQFLGRRLISWQCKKQTIIATSTTKAEYVAAASCCGQAKVSITWLHIWKRLKGMLSFMRLWTFYHAFIHLGFSNKSSLGKEYVSKQGRKKAKTRTNIKEGDFNKLDDLVDEGADYVVNEGRSTDKIKVLNAESKGVSTADETLSAATLAVSTVSFQTVLVLLKLLRSY
nr:hypothetical protein [Tanacetum cinerariifolium]